MKMLAVPPWKQLSLVLEESDDVNHNLLSLLLDCVKKDNQVKHCFWGSNMKAMV
ncbi:hypothetical protein Sjap_010909 [Stephania japonica]|uniref:Uncharacterized protein n=1 Tax=Stephania japonica TaxID=461633 RepID=A0AAP0JA30_9MAGN